MRRGTPTPTYHIPGDELVIVDDQTIEKEYGWFFVLASRRFLQSRDFRDAIAGNGPILVERDSGDVHQFPTARPLDDYVRLYEAGDWPG